MNMIMNEIQKLKIEKNAIILAHNYQLPEIHDVADYVGDSLGLSIKATETDANVIIFCGVYFMAETAKILSPKKTILIPEKKAGCPMADMVKPEDLIALKAKHPKAKVLCYVNTSAEVKALCDLCCTSANAEKIAQNALKDTEEVIFVPDKCLGSYVANKTGRKFILWNGFCPTHYRMLPEHVETQKNLHPDAEVIFHPECSSEVVALADQAISTNGMCKYAKSTNVKEMIIGTEIGMLYRLRKENPDKTFYPVTDLAVCPNMKMTTLDKVVTALKEMCYEVKLDKKIMAKARLSINKMLEYR